MADVDCRARWSSDRIIQIDTADEETHYWGDVSIGAMAIDIWIDSMIETVDLVLDDGRRRSWPENTTAILSIHWSQMNGRVGFTNASDIGMWRRENLADTIVFIALIDSNRLPIPTAVSSFGHATVLRIFIDPGVMQYDGVNDMVRAAPGTWNDYFAITPNDLVRVSDGTVVDLKRD